MATLDIANAFVCKEQKRLTDELVHFICELGVRPICCINALSWKNEDQAEVGTMVVHMISFQLVPSSTLFSAIPIESPADSMHDCNEYLVKPA